MLVLSTAISLLLNCYYTLHPPGGASPWFARSECAALGLLASAALRVIRHQGTSPFIRNGAAWVSPLTLGMAIICFSWSVYPILAITLGPLFLAVSLNYLNCGPELLRSALSVALLRRFGICSFSLYIWQQLFYVAYEHGSLQRQVAGILAMVVAMMAFYLFEDPVRRYLNDGPIPKATVAPVAQVEKALSQTGH
jgi:peptidoglycan/LPS O-acetylase OafA/YrhL